MARQTVDVVIPTFGQRELTLAAIASVHDGKNYDVDIEVVVIDDCGPDESLRGDLRELSRDGKIILIENPENLGFPQSCNAGMALHPGRDVVLLNSDCQVNGDWLDRLRRAAYSNDRVFSVTPLTNDGTICSYPQWLVGNSPLNDCSFSELDGLARQANRGQYVQAPTGVGFCMYLRRDGLDEVGNFNADVFGIGYGEETDLCLRASRVDWIHLIATDVFVAHAGGSSFGDAKQGRLAAAAQQMEASHPGYGSLIASFLKDDPVQRARLALDCARVQRELPKSTLYVTASPDTDPVDHGLREAPSLYCYPGSESGQLSIQVEGFENTPALLGLSERDEPADFALVLEQLGVAAVHVNGLASFLDSAPDFFRIACGLARVSYDVWVQDSLPICPRGNLVDADGFSCPGPDFQSCNVCVTKDAFRPEGFVAWDWLERYRRFFMAARSVYVASEEAQARFERYFSPAKAIILAS